MKVLLVSPESTFYGGGERVIVKLCNYFRDNSIVHTLAIPKMTDEMRNNLSGTPILNNIPALVENINRFDVVNFHNFPATLWSMFSTKPMVWTLNEPAELFTNWKRKFIEWGNRNLVKNRIENVVVADKFNARRCFDIYKVIPKVIPYGIDYEFFSEANHDPDRKFFTVMQVGTISRYKNQLATIKAVAKAKNYISNIRLWLVGNVSEPDYKNEIETAIRDYGLGGLVKWEPHVDRSHLRNLYSAADVLMHPVKEQGGWLSPFEAISAGCPVIVSNELTCSEMIQTNQLGLVTRDYASALKQVYGDSKNIRVMTSIARNWVRQNLTWGRYCESMVKYYAEVSGVPVVVNKPELVKVKGGK